MKPLLLILVAGLSILTACKSNQKDNHLKRIVFDPGKLQFIASAVNEKHQTMSALYGNPQAYQALTQHDSILPSNAALKLVTWRYHENPQYTGGQINGELLYIETLQSGKKNKWSYQMEEIEQPSAAHPNFKDQDRIGYILGYKPVTFP